MAGAHGGSVAAGGSAVGVRRCVVASELRQLAPLLEPDAVDAVAAGLVAMGEVDGTAGVRRVRPARGPVRPRPAVAGPGGPAPWADRAVLWARHRRRDHRVPDAAEPRSPRRPRSRRQRPVRQARPSNTTATTRATRPPTRGPSTNAAATPSSRSAAAGSLARPTRADPPAARTASRSFAARRARLGSRPPSSSPSAWTTCSDRPARCPGRRRRRRHPPRPGDRATAGLRRHRHPRSCAADGHVLHWGRDQRYFTTAQTRALWLRDRHCTFPRCTPPRPGATPTTSGTGSTADPPTSPRISIPIRRRGCSAKSRGCTDFDGSADAAAGSALGSKPCGFFTSAARPTGSCARP